MLISDSSMLHCCLIDDPMKEHWSNTDDFVLNLNHHSGFVFNVLICKTLIFLADSVVIGWWLFERTLTKQRSFCCKKYWSLSLLMRYIPKHWQFIAASLMFRWSSILGTLTTSFKLLRSTNVLVFIVLIRESLIFHRCCGDVSLMLLWGTTDETAMIWMKTISIFYVFKVLVFEKLMFPCCFIDDSLMIFSWDIDEKCRFRCKHYWLVKILMC